MLTTQQKLDHCVDRLTDISTMMKIYEKRIVSEKNEVFKATVLQLVRDYENLRIETLGLLEKFFEENRDSKTVSLSYRSLKRKLT